jgi:hypothetical protein
MNRTLNRVILKSTSGAPAWDTGLSVVLKTDEGTPVTVATAAEVASGHYRANFTSVEKWGFWYVGGTKMSDWGGIWLGAEPSAPAANAVVAVNAAGTERTVVALTASRFVVTDVAGALSTSSVLGVGSDTANEYISISGVGSLKGVALQVAAYTNKTATVQFFAGAPGASTLRWQIGKNATAEGGSNSGSDFLLAAYNDTGGLIGTALSITRSTMLALFAGPVVSSSYLQGTYLELSSDLYLRGHVYVRNKANSAWNAILTRDTSAAEVRFGMNQLSQVVINNYTVGGARQTVLRLGNFTDSLNWQHEIVTEDQTDQSLIMRSNRWQGGQLWERNGSAGFLKTAHLWSNEATSAWFELYTKGPSTQTVHSKLAEGLWTLTPSSGAAQVLLKVATYSTSGVAVQCDSANGSLVLNTLDARAIVFKVQNSQKAQFDSNGKFQFGTTTATHDWTFEDAKTIGSKTFQTGIFGGGFKLDQGATLTSQSRLEIDNILVRGSMRVHIFQKDIVRATNGYLFISDATTATTAVAITGSGPWQIPLKESVFQGGDLIWIKDIDESGGGLTVLSVFLEVVDDTDPASPWFDYVSGDFPATVKSGMTLVRIGNTYNTARQGSIFFDASGDNPPYMDVYDGRTGIAPVFPKVRLGKLAGITDAAFGGTLSGYGIYTENGYFKGNIVVASSTSIALAASTISIGNVTGTANYGLKLTKTGTASTSGLFGYDGAAAELFALRLDGTAQIAGFTFTATKLEKATDSSNGLRLESTSTLAGLAVKISGSDVVKVGRFTPATPTFPLTFRTWTDGTFDSSWTGTPTGWSRTLSNMSLDRSLYSASGAACFFMPAFTAGGLYGTLSSSTFTLADLKGKTVRFSFYVAATEENEGETALMRDCYFGFQADGIEIVRSFFTFPAAGDGYSLRTVDFDIPLDCTTGLVYFWLGDLAPSGRAWAGHFVDNVEIRTYDQPFVQLSQVGLEIHNSPTSRIRLVGGAEAVLPYLAVTNYIQVGTKWKIRENRSTNYLEFWYNGSLKAQVSTAGVWTGGL